MVELGTVYWYAVESVFLYGFDKYSVGLYLDIYGITCRAI